MVTDWVIDKWSGITYDRYSDKASFYITNKNKTKRFKVIIEREFCEDFIDGLGSAFLLQMNMSINRDVEIKRKVRIINLNKSINDLKNGK